MTTATKIDREKYKELCSEVIAAYSDYGWMDTEYQRLCLEKNVDPNDIQNIQVGDIWSDLIDKTCGVRNEEGTRNLRFRASKATTPGIASWIMKRACSRYNDFKPELLERLPEDCLVTIAREESVCIYVSNSTLDKLSSLDLQCDEISLCGKDSNYAHHRMVGEKLHITSTDDLRCIKGEIRIWWD